MEMVLEKQELAMQQKLLSDGYIILKDFFDVKIIHQLRDKAKKIFQIQFDYLGYEESFDQNMFRLFLEQEEIFINCGKLIQTGLLELYDLCLNKKLINTILELGLDFPNLCTRPVLFFNHPKLAKQEFYYKTPPHQDWSSMLSSSDSLVVWVPLVDVNENNGSILIWPKSHLLGPLNYESVGGFAKVQIEGLAIQPQLQVGDIIIFSTLLVHSSGEILDNSIRWSCHFRYTNMLDKDFINRGFPNPYIYKPLTKI